MVRSGKVGLGGMRHGRHGQAIKEAVAVDYQAAQNNRLGIDDEEAQIIGETLERIEQEHGGSLTPAQIVDAARPVTSPLHVYIWSISDEDAAYHHRLAIARQLKSAVRVKIITSTGEEVSAPSRISIRVQSVKNGAEPRAATPAYYPVAHVMSDATLKAKAAETILRRVYGSRDELALYPQFAGIVRELDKAIAALERGKERHEEHSAANGVLLEVA